MVMTGIAFWGAGPHLVVIFPPLKVGFGIAVAVMTSGLDIRSLVITPK